MDDVGDDVVVSDADLIGWSLGAHPESFGEVARRHERALWAYLRRRTSRPAAEDLLGEVWVTAFAVRGSYDRAFPDARPWLYGIAFNSLRRHWRHEERERPTEEIPAGSANPWPEVDSRLDVQAAMTAALGGLRPVQAELLRLSVWEQLSIADAARSLNIPAGTARSHMHQARRSLQANPAVRALLSELNLTKETR